MTTEPKIGRPWCRHPVVSGVIAGSVTFVITALAVSLVPLAWAVSVPIANPFGKPFVIDLGDLPPWIGAVILSITWYEARKAKKAAAEAAVKAAAGVAKIEAVAVQIDGLLAERDKAKIAEGEKKEKLVAEDTAATLARGQEEGRRAAVHTPDPEALAKAPPAAAIAAPPAAAIAAPPVVATVVPPAVEEAVKAAFERERGAS